MERPPHSSASCTRPRHPPGSIKPKQSLVYVIPPATKLYSAVISAGSSGIVPSSRPEQSFIVPSSSPQRSFIVPSSRPERSEVERPPHSSASCIRPRLTPGRSNRNSRLYPSSRPEQSDFIVPSSRPERSEVERPPHSSASCIRPRHPPGSTKPKTVACICHLDRTERYSAVDRPEQSFIIPSSRPERSEVERPPHSSASCTRPRHPPGSTKPKQSRVFVIPPGAKLCNHHSSCLIHGGSVSRDGWDVRPSLRRPSPPRRQFPHMVQKY